MHTEQLRVGHSIVSCACCGSGTLEIKCPYKYKENLPTDNSDLNFHVRFDSQEGMLVKRDHEYYAQMQMHMLMTKTKYCFLYIYSAQTSHRSRVERDEDFISETACKCTDLYLNIIASYLVANYADL